MPSLKWDDIAPFFRDFNATYDGKVYTVPLDGDFHMVYYRSDLIAGPAEDVGRLPRDRRPSTTARTSTGTASPTTARASPRRTASRASGGSSRSLRASSRARAPARARSSTRPTWTRCSTTRRFAKALETYKKTMDYGPPDEINLGVGDTRGLFTTGRCALSMDWGDIGTLALGTYAAGQDRRRRSPRAGRRSSTGPPASSCRATRPPAPTRSTASTTPPSPHSVAGRARSMRRSRPGEEGRGVRLPVLHERAGAGQRGRHPRQDRLQPVSASRSSRTWTCGRRRA